MKKINVELEGIVPILFNRVTKEIEETLKTGTRGKKLTESQRIAEAYEKVYRQDNCNDKGPIGLPTGNIKKSMREGCQKAKLKLGQASAEPYMRALVFLETEFVSFGEKKPDGIHSCIGRIPPKTGPRAIIRRPYLDKGWKLNFTIHIVDERITPNMVEISFVEAGLIVGLGDNRPEFGRFKVNKFEEEHSA